VFAAGPVRTLWRKLLPMPGVESRLPTSPTSSLVTKPTEPSLLGSVLRTTDVTQVDKLSVSRLSRYESTSEND